MNKKQLRFQKKARPKDFRKNTQPRMEKPPEELKPEFKTIPVVPPTSKDINEINSLQIIVPKIIAPIDYSEGWLEFDVFLEKYSVSPSTVNNWMNYGWLPYSQIVRTRYIHGSDMGNMLLQFRVTGKKK